MTYPSSGSSRRVALIAVAAAAVAASACSTSTGSFASPSSHSTSAKLVTSYSWSFTQVTASPASSAKNTQVTGISNLSTSGNPEIVGSYFNNCLTTACITTYYSFTSVGPNYTTFIPVSYPRIGTGSTGTQMNAIEPQSSASASPILVGLVSDPGDSGAGDIYPVLYNQGLWSLEPENGSDGGHGGKDSGYLFGINDNQIAVGYYTKNGNPTTTAYEVSPPSPSPPANSQFADVPFPTMSPFPPSTSWAYGINDNGDMVGTAIMANSSLPVAWYALCHTTCSPSSPSSSYCWSTLDLGPNTTAYAINNSEASGGFLPRHCRRHVRFSGYRLTNNRKGPMQH